MTAAVRRAKNPVTAPMTAMATAPKTAAAMAFTPKMIPIQIQNSGFEKPSTFARLDVGAVTSRRDRRGDPEQWKTSTFVRGHRNAER